VAGQEFLRQRADQVGGRQDGRHRPYWDTDTATSRW
jgi:hypothetical protein